MYKINEKELYLFYDKSINVNSVIYSELLLTDHIENYYDLNITIEKEN